MGQSGQLWSLVISFTRQFDYELEIRVIVDDAPSSTLTLRNREQII